MYGWRRARFPQHMRQARARGLRAQPLGAAFGTRCQIRRRRRWETSLRERRSNLPFHSQPRSLGRTRVRGVPVTAQRLSTAQANDVARRFEPHGRSPPPNVCASYLVDGPSPPNGSFAQPRAAFTSQHNLRGQACKARGPSAPGQRRAARRLQRKVRPRVIVNSRMGL